MRNNLTALVKRSLSSLTYRLARFDPSICLYHLCQNQREIDGRIVTLELVKLGEGNSSDRKRLRDFLRKAIAQESDAVLNKLNNAGYLKNRYLVDLFASIAG